MKLLEKLCQTAGTPGREHRVRELIKKEVKGIFDKVTTDNLGNLICVKKPTTKGKKNPTKMMLASHMDQIGFMVRYIDDKGFLRLNPTGGFDTRNLFARIVTVCPDPNNPKKDIKGILNPGVKPLHISKPEDRTKVPAINEFVVDMGMDVKEVKKKVKIGDMVVLDAAFNKIGDVITGQCMDNRVACWIAIRAMKQIKKHDCEIHCVFTVQEEVGLRGAITSAYAVKPDIGIGIDTTLACDTPGVPADMATTILGGGAGITCMDGSAINDYDVIEAFEAVAKKNKIPYQRSILTAGGTDSGGIQKAAEGAKTLTLSCPTRYIHTVVETISQTDLNACRDLLVGYLTTVK